ncbi:MAG TPA: PQQ-binding-like beta-propeller repeat protein, partial [Phytomonospora sp.]
MPEYRIDLDVPEEAPPPPRGLRRRGFLFGGAAVAVLAAGAGLTRLTGPDEPPGPIELREEWSHRLPTTLGTVVSAQVRDTTVLVAAQNGLLAVDRGTGTALWSRALGPEILGALAGGLTRDNVWFYVRLAGNTLVIPRYTDGVHSAFEAIDLRSGATRYTLPVVSGPDGEPPAQSRLTENTLLVQGFADEIAAYALDDGRRLWRRPLVEAIAVLPSDVSLNHQHTGIANTGPGHIEPVGGVYLEVRIP